MRRLPWHLYRRKRANHAFALTYTSHGLRASVETYLNDWRGYPGRVLAMPRCVFVKRQWRMP